MNYREITTFASSYGASFRVNYKNIHYKINYIERLLPLHLTGIKMSYSVYLSLLNDKYLDNELKELFIKLTKVVSFLYGKELIKVKTNKDGEISKESILIMIKEVETLNDILNNEDVDLDFSLLEEQLKTDYERDIEEIIRIDKDVDFDSFKSKDYPYLVYLNGKKSYFEVFNSTCDEKDFEKNKKIMALTPSITGNYEIDKSVVLLEMIDVFKAENSIKDFKNGIIATNNMHIEIAHFYNSISQMLVYLKNSYSFRENKLFLFDKMEFENHINSINSYLFRTKTSLLNLLNLK